MRDFWAQSGEASIAGRAGKGVHKALKQEGCCGRMCWASGAAWVLQAAFPRGKGRESLRTGE